MNNKICRGARYETFDPTTEEWRNSKHTVEGHDFKAEWAEYHLDDYRFGVYGDVQRYLRVAARADGCIMMFQVISRKSLEHLKEFFRLWSAFCGKLKGPKFFIVANKIDFKHEEWEVSLDEAENFAKQVGARFMAVSTWEDIGLGKVIFDSMISQVVLHQAAKAVEGTGAGSKPSRIHSTFRRVLQAMGLPARGHIATSSDKKTSALLPPQQERAVKPSFGMLRPVKQVDDSLLASRTPGVPKSIQSVASSAVQTPLPGKLPIWEEFCYSSPEQHSKDSVMASHVPCSAEEPAWAGQYSCGFLDSISTDWSWLEEERNLTHRGVSPLSSPPARGNCGRTKCRACQESAKRDATTSASLPPQQKRTIDAFFRSLRHSCKQ